jgi:hypothetical protein
VTCDRKRARADRRGDRIDRSRHCPGATVPVAAGSLALLGAVWGFHAPIAVAASSGGIAVLAPPGDTVTRPLSSGVSTTLFTVALPADASCAGDTAHQGYHVYSYLVKSGTDLDEVHFAEQPSTGYGLFDTAHEYYGPADTALRTGEITEIPNDFEWGSMLTSSGGTVPLSALLYSGSSGVWETGVLCANTNGVPTNDWNAQITFTAAGAGPDGFTWSASPEAYPFNSISTSTSPASSGSTSPSGGAVSAVAPATTPSAPSTTPTSTPPSTPLGHGGSDNRLPTTAVTAPGRSDGLLIGILVAAIVVILVAISLVTRRATMARRRVPFTAVGGIDEQKTSAGRGGRR